MRIEEACDVRSAACYGRLRSLDDPVYWFYTSSASRFQPLRMRLRITVLRSVVRRRGTRQFEMPVQLRSVAYGRSVRARDVGYRLPATSIGSRMLTT